MESFISLCFPYRVKFTRRLLQLYKFSIVYLMYEHHGSTQVVRFLKGCSTCSANQLVGSNWQSWTIRRQFVRKQNWCRNCPPLSDFYCMGFGCEYRWTILRSISFWPRSACTRDGAPYREEGFRRLNSRRSLFYPEPLALLGLSDPLSILCCWRRLTIRPNRFLRFRWGWIVPRSLYRCEINSIDTARNYY